LAPAVKAVATSPATSLAIDAQTSSTRSAKLKARRRSSKEAVEHGNLKIAFWRRLSPLGDVKIEMVA